MIKWIKERIEAVKQFVGRQIEAVKRFGCKCLYRLFDGLWTVHFNIGEGIWAVREKYYLLHNED